jgi:hypothetical protein
MSHRLPPTSFYLRRYSYTGLMKDLATSGRTFDLDQPRRLVIDLNFTPYFPSQLYELSLKGGRAEPPCCIVLRE